MLYVLKRSFDRTNLSLFLHYSWLLLMYLTTVKLIQVIIFYLSFIIHQLFFYGVLLCLIWNHLQVIRSILLLLICDLCVSYSLGQCSLILKLVLGCGCKLLVGRIQTGHTHLLTLQAYRRSWWGCGFLIAHVAINTLISSKPVTQDIHVWSCVGKCCLKGHKIPLG